MSKSFCFQETQASRAQTSHSEALLVLKETKDLLVGLDPWDLKAPKERRGKTALDQVGWNMCDGEEHHVPMVLRLFIRVRTIAGQYKGLWGYARVHSSFDASAENFVGHSNSFQEEQKSIKLNRSKGALTRNSWKRMTNVPTAWIKAIREKHPPRQFFFKLMLKLKL